jgi:hypothetical protein
LYQPFISIWVKHDPELVRHALTAVLMVVLFCVNISRQVLLTFKSAAALWKPDRLKPLVAGIFNLVVSISLIVTLPDAYKIDCVIFATLAGYALIQIPWETHVVFTAFFNRDQAQKYWKQQLFFAAAALGLCSITWLAVNFIALDRLQGLLLKGGVAALVSGGLMLVLFRRDVLDMVKTLGQKRA